jgi:hypothetical protein
MIYDDSMFLCLKLKVTFQCSNSDTCAAVSLLLFFHENALSLVSSCGVTITISWFLFFTLEISANENHDL